MLRGDEEDEAIEPARARVLSSLGAIGVVLKQSSPTKDYDVRLGLS